MNQRDIIELKLRELFPGAIHNLDKDSLPLVNASKNGNYGYSLLGLKTSVRPEDPQLPSNVHPQGLLYHTERGSFGIRIAPYPANTNYLCVVCTSPCGEQWPEELNQFRKTLEEAMPEMLFFVRHLSQEDHKRMEAPTNLSFFTNNTPPSPWVGMDFTPWEQLPQRNGSPSFRSADDQEYGHRMLYARDLASEYDGNVTRINNKRAKRTHRFMNENNLTLEWDPLTEANKEDARALVSLHFPDSAACSYYDNILNTSPEVLAAAGVDCRIAYLTNNDTGLSIPLSLFAVEPLNADKSSYGMYAGFSHVDPDYVARVAQDTNYCDIIHRLSVWTFLHHLSNENPAFTSMDMGGSETLALDDFKRDIGANEQPSYWVTSLASARKASHAAELIKDKEL